VLNNPTQMASSFDIIIPSPSILVVMVKITFHLITFIQSLDNF